MSESEDQMLARISVEQVLARLAPADRCMMRLIFQLECPLDWTGDWPMTYTDIGNYVGMRFEGRVLSEAAMRYRRDVVKKMLRGDRGTLRRNRRESTEGATESS